MVRIGILARRILADVRARMDAIDTNESARDGLISRDVPMTKGEPPGVTHIRPDTLPAPSVKALAAPIRIKEGRVKPARVAGAGASHMRRGEET